MSDAPERKVVFLLKASADGRQELASDLFNLATMIEREEIHGPGVSGGCSSGYVYEYREGDGPTREEYFKKLDAYLESQRAARSATGEPRG